jgi:hypothetical protein
MRVLFATVGVLGLFLVGLSVFEIRIVREYRTKVHDVQYWLAAIDRKNVEQAKSRNMTFTGTSVAYQFGEEVDGLEQLERGWLACAFVGGAIFVLGVADIILERRRYLQKSSPNKSLQATAAAPASSD